MSALLSCLFPFVRVRGALPFTTRSKLWNASKNECDMLALEHPLLQGLLMTCDCPCLQVYLYFNINYMDNVETCSSELEHS